MSREYWMVSCRNKDGGIGNRFCETREEAEKTAAQLKVEGWAVSYWKM